MKGFIEMKNSEANSKTMVLVSGERGLTRARAKLKSSAVKKLIAALTAFWIALSCTAAAVFPGVYPLGIAVVSSMSGFAMVSASYVGALIGSAFIPGIGGVTAVALTVVFMIRAAVSLYLNPGGIKAIIGAEDGDGTVRKNGGRSFASGRGAPSGSAKEGAVLRILRRTLRLGEAASSIGLYHENVRLRLVISSIAALICGAWSVVMGGFEYFDLVGAVLSLSLTPVFTYLLYSAFEKRMRASAVRELGVFFALAMVAFALHSLELPLNFDIGLLFSFICAVFLTSRFGVYRGLALSVVCGMVIDVSCIPALSFAAFMCVAFEKFSPILSSIAVVSAASAWGIFSGGLSGFLMFFPPAVISSSVTLPMLKGKINPFPRSLFGGELKNRQKTADEEIGIVRASESSTRLTSFSSSLISSSAVMRGVSEKLRKPPRSELSSIVSDTFERYCGLCKNRTRCKNHTEGLKKVMADSLSECGEVTAASVPSAVATVCYNIGRIIDEINSAMLSRVSGMREGDFLGVAADDMAAVGEILLKMDAAIADDFAEDRDSSSRLARLLAANNFHAADVRVVGHRRRRIFVGEIDLSSTRMGGDDIKRLIGEIMGGEFEPPSFALEGAELSMKIESAKKLSVRDGSYSLAASSVQMYCGGERDCGAKMRGDCRPTIEVSDSLPSSMRGEVSGDNIVSFEHEGRYYMILSDGMGSGKEASLASGMALTLLEKYIRGGADLESALKLLNRIIRSTGRECSTTIDICELDLYTGEARFIKSGAAPSFVLRGGSVFKLRSKTVPIGIIRALDAEMIKFDTEAGDTVVMVSDGVARSYDDAPWLLDLMTNDENVLRGEEVTAAVTIVSEAALRGSADDITCGIVRVGRCRV